MEKEEKEKKEERKEDFMSGKMIEPLKLKGNENVSDFVKNVYANSGFNARRLAEACEIFRKMIENKDTTICLTLAGAMTPIGMSGPIIELMEAGFIDFIISTGANLYHDLHRPYDYPMKQGEVFVDDPLLNKLGISRIYDVYIEDSETLMATDEVILKTIKRIKEKSVSSAEFNHELGKSIWRDAKWPEKSMLALASKLNIPIYCSAPGDSAIGMNISGTYLFGKKIFLDPIKDVLETSAIVFCSKKNGAIEIGGGSPKNFYMQTQCTLWQIFRMPKKGHDYFVQLTVDAPHWGGLSGATPQEAKSWGKIRKESKTNVVVYSCASITFPLLCQYILQTCKPRKQKELYLKREELVKKLKEKALSVQINVEEFRKIFGEEPK